MNFENAFKGRWPRKKEPNSSSSTGQAAAGSSSYLPTSSPMSSTQPQQGPGFTGGISSSYPLPQYNRLPVSSDPQHPLRVLHDLFLYSPTSRKGWFNHTAHATFLRQLFFTIWYRPEWIPLFELDKIPEGQKMPKSKDIHDWLPIKDGVEKPWSLSEYQKGLEGYSSVRPGAICGRVLHRYERTYTCK